METRLTRYQAHDILSIHSTNVILYGVVEGSFPILQAVCIRNVDGSRTQGGDTKKEHADIIVVATGDNDRVSAGGKPHGEEGLVGERRRDKTVA